MSWQVKYQRRVNCIVVLKFCKWLLSDNKTQLQACLIWVNRNSLLTWTLRTLMNLNSLLDLNGFILQSEKLPIKKLAVLRMLTRWFLNPKSIGKAVHLLTSSQAFIFWTVNSQYLDSFTMWVLKVWRRSLLSAIFPVFPLSSSTPRIILLSHASRILWSKWHSSEKLEHNERILELGGFSAVQKVIKKTHWEQYHFTLLPLP